MHKVGFLILDDIHHVHHLAPVAFEFSYRTEYQCTIFIQRPSRQIVKKLAQLYPNHRCHIQVLTASLLTRWKYKLRHRTVHSARIIKSHVDPLLQFDALISADRDMHPLASASANAHKRPLFFVIEHGAGDRNVTEYSTDNNIDFMLLPGKKYQQRFHQAGYLSAHNHAVVGYPKFDVIPKYHQSPLFENHQPVILYNPHFILEISSWEKWGLQILEYFYAQNRYNFIFAPHRNLFNRNLSPKILPKKYFQAPQMIIDLGSEKSVDMTYTQAADIYLGDVSSQVYEFIRHPRPCIFLNSQGIKWHDNPYYHCWHLGAVIEELAELWPLLNKGIPENSYIELQKQSFNETFSITDEPAARRAAEAIHKHIEEST
jgi:hypothetical protein